MKLVLAAASVLAASTSFAAPTAPKAPALTLKALQCTAVNTLGYADLRLEGPDQVNIVINSAFASQASVTHVGQQSLELAEVIANRKEGDVATQYRIEFSQPLHSGEQSAQGPLYAKVSRTGPYVVVSYATCKLNLEEVGQ